MKRHTRTLIVGVSALVALGTVSACSGGTSTEATSSEATTTSAAATVKAFPPSAKYIADIPTKDGQTMTVGIAVDGADITAYACNGVDDEAWFFSDHADGKLDITGKFHDTLKAEFDGTATGGHRSWFGRRAINTPRVRRFPAAVECATRMSAVVPPRLTRERNLC